MYDIDGQLFNTCKKMQSDTLCKKPRLVSVDKRFTSRI